MCDLLNKFIQFLFSALNLLSRIDFAPSYNDNCNYAYGPDSVFSEKEKTNRKTGLHSLPIRIYLQKKSSFFKRRLNP